MYLSSGPEDNEEESSGFPSDFDTDTVVEFVAHGTEMKEEKEEKGVDDNPETLLLGTVASEIIIISDDEEKEVKIKEEEEEEEENDADDEETESESEETMLDKVLHGRDPEETGRQLMEARARF
ncbi:nephrocystin 1-like protein, partial [Reticulomyxa filosa]